MNLKPAIIIIYLLGFTNVVFAQWETVYSPLLGNTLPWLNTVTFRDFNNGFAAGYTNKRGCVLQTNDNGTTWSTVFTTNDTMQFYDITFSDSNTIFVAGASTWTSSQGGMIAKSNDLGTTWTALPTHSGLSSISFPSSSVGYVAGDFGTIMKTVNAGGSWNTLTTGITSEISSIYFIDSLTGFAGSGKKMLKTTDGGQNWTTYNFPGGDYIVTIYFPSVNIGYCRSYGTAGNLELYKTTDQGLTWNLAYLRTTSTYCTSMFFSNDTIGYLSVSFAVLKTIDGGMSWNHQSSVPVNFFDDVTDVYFINRDTGFAVGAGQFYRTVSGGELIGINEYSNFQNNSLIIFPNPANENITLDLSNRKPGKVEISVFNSEGRRVHFSEENNIQGELNLNISLLENGIYLISVISNDDIPKRSLFVKGVK